MYCYSHTAIHSRWQTIILTGKHSAQNHGQAVEENKFSRWRIRFAKRVSIFFQGGLPTGRGTDRSKSTEMSNPFRFSSLFLHSTHFSFASNTHGTLIHFHSFLIQIVNRVSCTFIKIMTQFRKLFAK